MFVILNSTNIILIIQKEIVYDNHVQNNKCTQFGLRALIKSPKVVTSLMP